ncbi:hypothetical protein [Shouchella patagoniensis]|uniref:hypothetical protein n=1 Tax=Shouchella patagoniensis TaxID=228576 RepID=UPI000994CF81|nr:hypothetical protein [Shouchella patagoniensis]
MLDQWMKDMKSATRDCFYISERNDGTRAALMVHAVDAKGELFGVIYYKDAISGYMDSFTDKNLSRKNIYRTIKSWIGEEEE